MSALKNAKVRILATNSLHPRAVQKHGAEVEIIFCPSPSFEAIRESARHVDGIVVRAQLPEDIFDFAPNLRAAVRHGVGFDMIPIDAATRCGVPVANVPAVNAVTVAEFALMQMLCLARRQHQVRNGMQRRDWSAARDAADGAIDLEGRTVGIIGFGNIGMHLAHKARSGFGMNVVSVTRRPESLPDWVDTVNLASLCATSDFVVVCCPLNPETENLVGRAALRKMKKSAYLINVARGRVVDTEALLEVLRNREIAGAALDVHAISPLPEESPFHHLDNVILTPHMAGITEDSMERVADRALFQARQILEGQRPQHLINPEIWNTRRK